MNHCDDDVAHTRVTEHKHFAGWEHHQASVISLERSRAANDDDIPYHPVRLVSEMATLARYVDLARAERALTFVGRLGTYPLPGHGRRHQGGPRRRRAVASNFTQSAPTRSSRSSGVRPAPTETWRSSERSVNVVTASAAACRDDIGRERRVRRRLKLLHREPARTPQTRR